MSITHYLFIIISFTSSLSLHSDSDSDLLKSSTPHLSSRWNWKKTDCSMDMLWCRGGQKLGLFNHKLKSAL